MQYDQSYEKKSKCESECSSGRRFFWGGGGVGGNKWEYFPLTNTKFPRITVPDIQSNYKIHTKN
jgi:hypothetical protein